MSTRSAALAVCLLVANSVVGQEPPPPDASPRRLKPISATITTNQIPVYTNNSGTTADSIMTQANGNIGINTIDPHATLHLFGSATGDVFEGMGPDPGAPGPAMNFGYSG